MPDRIAPRRTALTSCVMLTLCISCRPQDEEDLRAQIPIQDGLQHILRCALCVLVPRRRAVVEEPLGEQLSCVTQQGDPRQRVKGTPPGSRGDTRTSESTP